MKVVHLNTNDMYGGAAIAARRLHIAMLENGIDSKMFVADKNTDLETVFGYSNFRKYFVFTFLRFLDKLFLLFRSSLKGSFSIFKFSAGIPFLEELKTSDIIYLHWVNNSFINFSALRKILKLHKPVYWFMHDMFPITGGCHHSFDCQKYFLHCNNCPYIKYNKKRDFSYKQFRRKKRLYQKYKNLTFVTPSKWLYSCVKQSGVININKVFYIPNLLDSSIFKPIDKKFVRRYFDIPEDASVILYGADNAINNPYKGFDYFSKAIEVLSKNEKFVNNTYIIIFGASKNNEIIKKLYPMKTVFLGKLQDEISLNFVYNLTDVFVISSIAENFPNTIVEAFSCGIPVVGFDVGGIPDLINKENGYLAKYKDFQDLANGIEYVLKNRDTSIKNEYGVSKIIELHKRMWSHE